MRCTPERSLGPIHRYEEAEMVNSVSSSYWRPAIQNLKDAFESQRTILMGLVAGGDADC
jgi:hypothetical protein